MGAAFLALSAPAGADTLIDNVDGFSLDAQGAVERFTGLLIGNDGRIEQVLRRGDKRPARADFKLDGHGRVLMPGLIDSHVQLMELGLSLLKPGDRPPGEPRPEDRDDALVKAQQFLLERGITTVADMGTTIADWQSYRRAGDLGRLTLRVVSYAGSERDMVLIGGPGPSPWLYDDRLKFNGLGLVLDGSLDARAALLKAPYAGASARAPTPLLGETQLKNLMSRGAIDNFQVAIEAHGDKAVAAVLSAIGELSQTYKGDRRWRIEGADVVDPVDAAKFGQLSVIASMQPLRVASASAMAEERLGPQRLGSAWPWKSLETGGAKLVFGSGAPFGQALPFAAIATAATRQGADGEPYGGWQPQERLTREGALAAYTASAAHALFAEGHFGRIAQGQRADFLLVDGDPLLASPSELRSIRVLQTWVGGRLVWQAAEGSAAGR